MSFDDDELLEELRRHRDTGKVSERLGEILIEVSVAVWNWFGPRWSGVDQDNAKGDLILHLLKSLDTIDVEKNPRSYLISTAERRVWRQTRQITTERRRVRSLDYIERDL